jgi:hypothetical protein
MTTLVALPVTKPILCIAPLCCTLTIADNIHAFILMTLLGFKENPPLIVPIQASMCVCLLLLLYYTSYFPYGCFVSLVRYLIEDVSF